MIEGKVVREKGIIPFCKRHWRKAAIISPILAFVSNLAYNRYREELAVIDACKKAKSYGDKQLRSVGERSKKVVLFVNPSANKQKAVAQIERSILPLLHLAGVDVRVVKLEAEGEAKQLVAASTDSDALAVAGGDGTVSEVITGMLLSDAKVRRQPLLVVPVGREHNSLFRVNYQDRVSKNTINNILETGKSYLQNSVSKTNLIKITPLHTQTRISTNQTQPKSVFTSVALTLGPFRDVLDEKTQTRFWYLGPLKKAFLAAFFSSAEKVSVMLKWTDVCSGCRDCKAEQINAEKERLKKANKRLWGSSVTKESIAESQKILKFDRIVNDSCAQVRSKVLEDVDYISLNPTCDGISVFTTTGLSASEFFTSAMSLFSDSTSSIFSGEKEPDSEIRCKELWLEPVEGRNFPEWFSIDNENFEAVPFHAQFSNESVSIFS